MVILSNQAGLTLHFDANYKGPKAGAQKRVNDFKQKGSAVLENLNLPTTLYAATARDIYRKPRSGMWKEICDDYDIPENKVDLAQSFFVGDAGGRIASLSKGQDGVAATAKDFSCSDRNFAHNVGIPYQTPEEYFLGEKPRDFKRDFDLSSFPYEENTVTAAGEPKVEKVNDRDIVLFCGPPGSGKSTFYWNHLKPLGYERINQDTLKSRDKCVKVAQEHLKEGDSIVIGWSGIPRTESKIMLTLLQITPMPIQRREPCGSKLRAKKSCRFGVCGSGHRSLSALTTTQSDRKMQSSTRSRGKVSQVKRSLGLLTATRSPA